MSGKGSLSGGERGAAVLLWALPVFVTLCYVLPFLGVAGWSVTRPEPGLQNYARVLLSEDYQSVLLRTFRMGLISTVATVLIAYAATYYWLLGSKARRRFMEFAIFVPFWISVLVRAFGWMVLLSNRGAVNTALLDLGLISEPLSMVRNEFAVIVGMVHLMVPFAVIPMAAAMRRIDRSLLLAAHGLGAGPGRIFREVWLPLSLPGLLSATVLVFIFSLGFFATPMLLGGGRVTLLAEAVYVQVMNTANWGLGAALSLVLLAVVGLILWAGQRLVRVDDMAR